MLKALFVAAVAAVFAGSVLMLRGGPGEAQGNIRVLSRLDEYTRNSNPNVANTIPTFLMQAGKTGVLPPPEAAPAPETTPPAGTTPAAGAEPAVEPVADAPIPVAAVKPLNEAELQKGFCTATLPRLVRQRYPGTYDDIPDEELENTVLKLHPDYKGRLCVLPVWIAADPHDIIKYDVSQDAAAIPQTVWLWSGLIAAGFAVAVLVAYKRFSD